MERKAQSTQGGQRVAAQSGQPTPACRAIDSPMTGAMRSIRFSRLCSPATPLVKGSHAWPAGSMPRVRQMPSVSKGLPHDLFIHVRYKWTPHSFRLQDCLVANQLNSPGLQCRFVNRAAQHIGFRLAMLRHFFQTEAVKSVIACISGSPVPTWPTRK